MRPVLLWYRDDLRLHDNSALAAAIASGRPVIPVYIHSPGAGGGWDDGAASRWWRHRSLESLAGQWRDLGGALVLRQGEADAILGDLIRSTGADAVYWNRRYHPAFTRHDTGLKRALSDDGVEVRSFNSSVLCEPHTVATGTGRPYQVYTPFWKAVSGRTPEQPDHPDLGALRIADSAPAGDPLDALGLLPGHPWFRKLERHWTPGEPAARDRLDGFLSGAVADYAGDRDIPGCDGTSRLSPHFRHGELGVREVAWRLHDGFDLRQQGPHTFLKEIYWRDFAHHVLFHFPHTADDPLREAYRDFPWQDDGDVLDAWRRGLTGYPIVDAGMRQLWETGWMHNRVRMITASLLVKQLLQHWKAGARWFWDTLVDADLASNSLGWQWSAGCGADAAPYFRVFNPVLQGRKFDPDGDYVRRFVPEIAALPDKHLHAPWEAPEPVLRKAGIRLGDTYPPPLIEPKAGRERALDALERFKQRE